MYNTKYFTGKHLQIEGCSTQLATKEKPYEGHDSWKHQFYRKEVFNQCLKTSSIISLFALRAARTSSRQRQGRTFTEVGWIITLVLGEKFLQYVLPVIAINSNRQLESLNRQYQVLSIVKLYHDVIRLSFSFLGSTIYRPCSSMTRKSLAAYHQSFKNSQLFSYANKSEYHRSP